MARAGKRPHVLRGRDWTGETVGNDQVRVVERHEQVVFPCGSITWKWRCLCACGKEFFVLSMNLTTIKSCGCFRADGVRAACLKHGYTVDRARTTEYTVWNGIKQRCENPNNPNFARYGERGVRVCPEWSASFETFLAAVGHRPSKAYSLDRFPNRDGNYEPGNVRWATRGEQALNRDDVIVLEHGGKQWTLRALALAHGLSARALKYRVFHMGISVAEAISRPAASKSR